MREEYKAIVDAGFLLQIDDPFLVTYYITRPDLSIAECRKWCELRVEALNHALAGIPEDRIRFHTCYSINMGPRVHDMQLKDIVDIILKVKAQAPIRSRPPIRATSTSSRCGAQVKLPDDKILIPGVITQSTVLVEHPELVAQRLERFADIVGRERVIAGADCGFASFAGSNEVHPSIVWAKFQALSEGARIASKRLWNRAERPAEECKEWRPDMMLRVALAALAYLATQHPALAQAFPDKAIRIISGTQTGTSGDLAGRLLAQKLTAQIGQPVVFESRPGANGQIAANYVKTLPPDGYSILYLASSTIITGPLMSKSVGFDTFKDFTPISIAVGAAAASRGALRSLGVDTTAGLVEYAKRNPGKLNYGSVGRGSVFHFQGEAMKVAAGIDMLHVPYTGANNANIIGDLLANRVQVYFPAYPATLAALPTGQVKLLGVFLDGASSSVPIFRP